MSIRIRRKHEQIWVKVKMSFPLNKWAWEDMDNDGRDWKKNNHKQIKILIAIVIVIGYHSPFVVMGVVNLFNLPLSNSGGGRCQTFTKED